MDYAPAVSLGADWIAAPFDQDAIRVEDILDLIACDTIFNNEADPELISGAELMTVQNLAYWRGTPKTKDVELVDALYERCREMAQ